MAENCYPYLFCQEGFSREPNCQVQKDVGKSKCRSQEQCKRVIFGRCLRGGRKACGVVIKGIKSEREV